MKKKTSSPPNTVITLTLPETGGAQRTGTLLVSRGDLAKLTQIRFADSDDLAEAIRAALNAIAELEFDPPADDRFSRAARDAITRTVTGCGGANCRCADENGQCRRENEPPQDCRR